MTQGFSMTAPEQARRGFHQGHPDDIHLCPLHGNPTNRMFEDRIAALEEGRGRLCHRQAWRR